MRFMSAKDTFYIAALVAYMEIGKSFSRGKLSWSIKYSSDEPAGNNGITGEIEIEISEPDEVDFPVRAGIRNVDPYISFESENPVMEFNSNTEKRLKFEVGETDNTKSQRSESEQESDDQQRCEIWFTDSNEGGNYTCTFFSEEVVSLCLQILTDDTNDDRVLERINEEYNSLTPAYAELRRHSRYITDFPDYVEVLNFLYKHTNPAKLDKDIEDEIFSDIKNRIIYGNNSYQSYESKSVADLKKKIDRYESKTYLPEIPNKDELLGLQNLKLADESVDDGEFRKAKEQISNAVERFEQSDSGKLLPAKLKRDAIRGLRNESRCEFEEAAAHYSDAAEKAEETENIRAYEAWSEVAKIKEQLSEGNFEKAREIAGGIDYDLDSIYLIELQKLTKLFEVYSDYAQDKRSDAAAVFADVGIEDKSKLPSSDAIVQFNTDYSTAFTMLITKQRRQQLGVDPEIGDDFRIIIRDAITPTGIEGNTDSEEQAEQNGTQQHQNVGDVGEQSEADSERGYTETKRAQRDSQFQEEVKEVYDQTCAICGADRMTPDRRPEVEAAHIRPVSEGGKDTITNGIALCRLHHWAFDNDWISIKDDYSIVVKDAPEVSGYEDFAQYQGSRLNIPKSEENQPDKNALQFHRRHHGFENGG